MKPLMNRRDAVARPHVVLLIALALILSWAAQAEAGRRGRKTKKGRDRTGSQAQSRAKPEQPTPPPSSGLAPAKESRPAQEGVIHDERSRRERLAKNGDSKLAKTGDSKPREKVFDFSGFELAGSVRMPQLLYFLDRAEEELERASLERRSFVPEMMRSLDEENL